MWSVVKEKSRAASLTIYDFMTRNTEAKPLDANPSSTGTITNVMESKCAHSSVSDWACMAASKIFSPKFVHATCQSSTEQTSKFKIESVSVLRGQRWDKRSRQHANAVKYVKICYVYM